MGCMQSLEYILALEYLGEGCFQSLKDWKVASFGCYLKEFAGFGCVEKQRKE